jgi:hypothetical protein
MSQAALAATAAPDRALAGIGAAERIFVDCAAAIDWARRQGARREARFLSVAPGLAGRDDVEIVDGDIGGGTIRDFVAAYSRASAEMLQALESEPLWRAEAAAAARAFLLFQNVAYKAFALRERHLARPFAIVGMDLPRLPRLNAPWASILDGHPRLAASLLIPAAECPPLPEAPFEAPDLRTRLRFESWNSILYRALQRLNRVVPLGFRGVFLVSGENALTKEVGLQLLLRGYNLAMLACPPAPAERLRPPEASALERAIMPTVNALFRGLMIGELAPRIADRALRQIAYSIGRRRAAAQAFGRSIDGLRRGRPLALLKNHGLGPDSEAVEEAARARGLPVVALQHGTGTEFTTLFEHIRLEEEIATCDLFLAFNEACAVHAESNPHRRGRAAVVGVPQDLALVGRHKPSGRPSAPIIYCSNQALMGNTHRPVNTGLPDLAGVQLEVELIDEVFERIPHRVLFKPYASFRYVDPLPSIARARVARNVTLFEPRIDLRYLLADCRLLIASLGHSTVSWCILSGKPVVFLDQPGQHPLRDDARAAFRAALFYVDCGQAGWRDELRALLSRPLEELERLYADKAAQRKALIECFIGAVDGRAGARAARAALAAVAQDRRRVRGRVA